MHGIEKAIKDSIDFANSNSEGYVPILIFAESIDHDCNFGLSAPMIPCPTINGDNGLQVDHSKLEPLFDVVALDAFNR